MTEPLTEETPFVQQIVAENGQLADRLAVAERKVEALRKFTQDVANSAPGQPTINDAYAFWVAGQQARALLVALDELDRAAQS